MSSAPNQIRLLMGTEKSTHHKTHVPATWPKVLVGIISNPSWPEVMKLTMVTWYTLRLSISSQASSSQSAHLTRREVTRLFGGCDKSYTTLKPIQVLKSLQKKHCLCISL